MDLIARTKILCKQIKAKKAEDFMNKYPNSAAAFLRKYPQSVLEDLIRRL
jgi:hypothetical protein